MEHLRGVLRQGLSVRWRLRSGSAGGRWVPRRGSPGPASPQSRLPGRPHNASTAHPLLCEGMESFQLDFLQISLPACPLRFLHIYIFFISAEGKLFPSKREFQKQNVSAVFPKCPEIFLKALMFDKGCM